MPTYLAGACLSGSWMTDHNLYFILFLCLIFGRCLPFRIVDDRSYQSSLSNHQLDEMQLCFSPIEIFSLWLDFTYLSTLIKYVFPQIWIVNFIFFTLGARKSYFNPIWNWVTLKLHQQGANSGQFEELDKPTNWTLLSENGGLVRSWINCWEKEYSRLYFWGQKMDTVTLTPADPGWLDITHKIPPRAIWLNYHTSNIVHLEINNDVLIDIVDWMDGTENRARLKVSRALNMKKKKLRI